MPQTDDPLAGIAAAFNATEPATCLSLLERHLTETAEVVHIHGESRGAQSFAEAIAEIHAAYGRLTVELVGEPRSLGRWRQRAWKLTNPPGGEIFARGWYVARLDDDGRVSHLLSLPEAHDVERP